MVNSHMTAFQGKFIMIEKSFNPFWDKHTSRHTWPKNKDSVDKFYEPCKFLCYQLAKNLQDCGIGNGLGEKG